MGEKEQPGEEPDYRFTLANERTFLAWIRTSMAVLAGGVAVVQFASSVGNRAGRYVLGELLIALSIVLAASSVRRWNQVQQAMRLGAALPKSALPMLLAGGLTAVAVVAFALVLAG